MKRLTKKFGIEFFQFSDNQDYIYVIQCFEHLGIRFDFYLLDSKHCGIENVKKAFLEYQLDKKEFDKLLNINKNNNPILEFHHVYGRLCSNNLMRGYKSHKKIKIINDYIFGV